MIGKIPPSASEEGEADRGTKEVRNEKRLLSTCSYVVFFCNILILQLQVAYFFAVCFLKEAKTK